MSSVSLDIDDVVAEASPVLRRARLDGLDCVSLPFAERYVQAWRGPPEATMDADMLLNVFKVSPIALPKGRYRPCFPMQAALPVTSARVPEHLLHCILIERV